MSFASCQQSENYNENEKSIAYEEMDKTIEMPNESKTAKKLIKIGSISFETNNAQESRKYIDSLVKKFNAYIANEEIFNRQNQSTQQLTVRIPANDYDQFVIAIEKKYQLENKSVHLNDVTEQFVDISARLKTKKMFEKRYMELLSKTKIVSEILSIEKQLEALRSDIEAVEGRLKLLNNQVSYATLDITFYKNIPSQESGNSIVKSLMRGWQNFVSFLSALVSVWPFLILFIILFYYRKRILKFRK